MDVQEFVETPQLYILACSSNSVAEKMVYVDDLRNVDKWRKDGKNQTKEELKEAKTERTTSSSYYTQQNGTNTAPRVKP